MIYTCTITPSIDYTVYVPEFYAGKLNRADEVEYYPGGKGINVSRVLKRLGVENTALGFTGGFTGDFMTDFLNKEGVTTDFIDTKEITRINVKIKADQASELNGPGPTITTRQQQALLDKLSLVQKGDWFILAGSLPDTLPLPFYETIAGICHKHGAAFVLDTSGAHLRALLQTKPFLIKPNKEELEALFDTTIRSLEEAVFYAKKLAKTGIQHVIVSLGGDGAILATQNQTWVAEAPKGSVINTVGAGDSLVAGFIAAYNENKNAKEAFRYGVASGSATAFLPDLCEKADVLKLIPQVNLEEMKQNENH